MESEDLLVLCPAASATRTSQFVYNRRLLAEDTIFSSIFTETENFGAEMRNILRAEIKTFR